MDLVWELELVVEVEVEVEQEMEGEAVIFLECSAAVLLLQE